MADKDQIRKDEEKVKSNEEPEVTELDDQDLDEVSGGVTARQDAAAEPTNGNCLC